MIGLKLGFIGKNWATFLFHHLVTLVTMTRISHPDETVSRLVSCDLPSVSQNFTLSLALIVGSSVTRFGKFSPLWKFCKGLWQNVKGLFTTWENFEPTSANFLCHWTNFHCCKWPNIKKVIL